jgi:hypothetical protein
MGGAALARKQEASDPAARKSTTAHLYKEIVGKHTTRVVEGVIADDWPPTKSKWEYTYIRCMTDSQPYQGAIGPVIGGGLYVVTPKILGAGGFGLVKMGYAKNPLRKVGRVSNRSNKTVLLTEDSPLSSRHSSNDDNAANQAAAGAAGADSGADNNPRPVAIKIVEPEALEKLHGLAGLNSEVCACAVLFRLPPPAFVHFGLTRVQLDILNDLSTHPSIVRVEDAFQLSNRNVYIVMELITVVEPEPRHSPRPWH